ncbi:unnamed protein product [Schistocephalus solidus]|uniref:Uncharacterized protein n=1 Tax=Schistocephalus solidus TaxID=70667 RepID=A0A183SD77_SCHSO|nr:unnamed protein product [Schistocephalus solidus]
MRGALDLTLSLTPTIRPPPEPVSCLMWEWAHWLTDRRTRLRAQQHDLAPLTYTPGFIYSGDMEEPSPFDSQSTGQPLETHSTYTGPMALSGIRSNPVKSFYSTIRREILSIYLAVKRFRLSFQDRSDFEKLNLREINILESIAQPTSHIRQIDELRNEMGENGLAPLEINLSEIVVE